MSGDLLVEKADGIGWIVFNRPDKHNALTLDMREQIAAALLDLGNDNDVRVVVLKGAGGRAFMAGADISEFGNDPGGQAEERARAAEMEAYDALGKPLIAMVRGYCMGAGMATALKADFRIAASDALFAIPAAKRGIGYPFRAVEELVQLVGPARAKLVLYTGRRFSAAEALALNLIEQVVAPGELEATVLSCAREIAANAPLSLASTRVSVSEALKEARDRDMDLVNAKFEAAKQSEDFRESTRAFMEKRPPVFRGK